MPDPIRRARRDEADGLSALARRSKAHWGYDTGFLERVRDAMTLRADDVERHQVWILESAAVRIGATHSTLIHGRELPRMRLELI